MFQPAQAVRNTARILRRDCAYWTYGELSEPVGAQPPVVVMVHGFRGDHHGLERIASGISEVRIIVPDVPGFGESEVLDLHHTERENALRGLGEWLGAFINHVTDGPVVLVGHSFGTLIVASALSLGCRVDRVVLINPISAPALKGPRASLSKLTLFYYQVAARLPRRLGDWLLKNALIVRGMSELMTKTRDPELRAWIHSQHGAHFSSFQDRDALIDLFRASISHTVFDFRDAFLMPTTVIASDKDDITPLSAQLVLAESLPDARFVVIPEVGHLIHYEEPERVTGEIDRAVRDIRAGQVS